MTAKVDLAENLEIKATTEDLEENLIEALRRIKNLEDNQKQRYVIKYRNGRMLETREITAKDYKDAFEQHVLYIRYLNATSIGTKYCRIGIPELIEINPRELWAGYEETRLRKDLEYNS